MIDNFRHQGMRKRLVAAVKEKGIKNELVLAAIGRIPRHWFLDSSFLEFAYQDKPFQIGCGQTISQPFTVAFQTELLEVSKGEKVLEIGTGSGYQACVLAEIGAKVYSIERQKVLYERTKTFLNNAGYHSVKTFYGDGYKGLPAFAPFDKIIITAGAPNVPEELVKQLKVNGFMVVPLGSSGTQVMTRVVKLSDTEYKKEVYGDFSFVPMLTDREDGNG